MADSSQRINASPSPTVGRVEPLIAWLVDEVKELRDQNLELAEMCQRHFEGLESEVRTRRVVVVNENGFESVVVNAGGGYAEVKVTSEEDPSVWTNVHACDEGDAATGLYLSGGGNGVGSFETYKNVFDRDTTDEVLDYRAMLTIDSHDDPRFHNVSLGREGLSFGG